ncbi:hypothetical protein CIK79_00810 [Brevibacterium aurantiacum]|uniref:Uncharacterized protein n=1 Tax=Brevibacterium aurantiacum TaxID=273384 RepID=A0A2A3WZW0_BREAU|nr:hypothetical protein CIK79_00810 [Brevibacterium aurantiacum]
MGDGADEVAVSPIRDATGTRVSGASVDGRAATFVDIRTAMKSFQADVLDIVGEWPQLCAAEVD